MSVDVVLEARAQLGEGPLWDHRDRRLVWLDILVGEVHRLDPSTGRDETTRLGGPVTAAGLRAQGGLVLALEKGFALLPDGATSPVPVGLPALSPDDGLRFNDGEVDADGALWAGTMPYERQPGRGAIYRLGPTGDVDRCATGIEQSNGMAFPPDGRMLLHVDTFRRRLSTYPLVGDGQLGARRTLCEFDAALGLPDGMAMDETGCVWVAFWGGGQLRRYAPDGRFLSSVPLPVSQPTSCAFGGDGYETLFVTSARLGLDDVERTEPLAGAVLALDVGCRGRPAALWGG